jgi:hypothetical protein
MKALKPFSRTGLLSAVDLAALGILSSVAPAATVDATYNSATDVPVTASGYTATGNTVSFTLNFAPVTGTDLTVVVNTGLDFINGTFENLTNGQAVALSCGATTYSFVANYYGTSSTARKALSLIINDLRRQQLVLALHFRSPWFSGHAFSLNVGGTATPAAINALWAWPST